MTKELDSGIMRQGDVLLVKAAAEVAGDPIARDSDGALTLKLGEATGHHHHFKDGGAILVQTASRERHLKIVETAFLDHEEHTRVEVAPGHYDLPNQVEWTDENEPRAVED